MTDPTQTPLDFKLTPADVDMLLFALQNGSTGPYTYIQVDKLKNKLVAQGRPQWDALITQKPEGADNGNEESSPV